MMEDDGEESREVAAGHFPWSILEYSKREKVVFEENKKRHMQLLDLELQDGREHACLAQHWIPSDGDSPCHSQWEADKPSQRS